MVDKTKTNKMLSSAYNIVITLLAVISIVMAIVDINGNMSSNITFYIVDNCILIIFAVDYIVRFILSEKKALFFKDNIFDLIAIIPFSSIFALFRFARLFRLAKFARLAKISKFARIVGIFGRIKKQISAFLNTNGFVYMLYTAAVLIVTSSVLMSYFEGKTFSDALWWSIVTCTTVGYGDISPSTGLGRVVAVILMIFGIGLISMLTGAVTTFFTNKKTNDQQSSDLHKIIDGLNNEQQQELLKHLKTHYTSEAESEE